MRIERLREPCLVKTRCRILVGRAWSLRSAQSPDICGGSPSPFVWCERLDDCFSSERTHDANAEISTSSIRAIEHVPNRLHDAGLECAYAQGCQHWDINGTWSINQSNGFIITAVVRQNNNEFAGTADYGSGPAPLVGTMRDNHLAMTVSWTSGGAGLYTAAMSRGGLLTDGFTQNISMPGSTATWSTVRQFECADKLPR
jgi:hypothetical protein